MQLYGIFCKAQNNLQFLNSDIPEFHNRTVSQESNMSLVIFKTWMIAMIKSSIIAGLCNVTINNDISIKNDFNPGTLNNDFLFVPFSNGFQEASFGWYYTINRSMVLIGLQIGINGCCVIEYL